MKQFYERASWLPVGYQRSQGSGPAAQLVFIYLFKSDKLSQQRRSSTIIRPIDRCGLHVCSGEGGEEAVMAGGAEPELTSAARVSLATNGRLSSLRTETGGRLPAA